MASRDLTWQPTLFDADAPAFDASFSRVERIHLDPAAWVDYAPEWVSGSDELFSLAYRHGLDPGAYAHKKQEGRPE